MKKIALLLCLVSLVAASCNNKPVLRQEQTLKIKFQTLTIQLADTPQERAQGLSGVSKIVETEGMLFLFSEPGKPEFWMKDMKFPIDIIWISGDTIVGITDSVRPQPNVSDENLTRYFPPREPADKVLEVNGGWTFRHDIGIGDKVTFIKP